MKISFKKFVWMSAGGGAVIAFLIGWNMFNSHKKADAACLRVGWGDCKDIKNPAGGYSFVEKCPEGMFMTILGFKDSHNDHSATWIRCCRAVLKEAD